MSATRAHTPLAAGGADPRWTARAAETVMVLDGQLAALAELHEPLEEIVDAIGVDVRAAVRGQTQAGLGAF